MSSETKTPALEGDVADEQEQESLGILGTITLAVRWAYNNPVVGFGMDMVAIGSIVFGTIILVMVGLVALSGLLGGWTGLYALFVLTFGGYGAYRKRLV